MIRSRCLLPVGDSYCGRPVDHNPRCTSIEAYQRGIVKTTQTGGANARSKDRRMWLGLLKLAYGCADCSYRDHAVGLDFDHLPGSSKVGSISVLVKHANTDALFTEIAKCEVVCKNCHAVRTVKRGQHIVTSGAW